ncbi:MAG: SpoIIIAH-like family protein [Ruminococcaceae bacterium]|nr:SpoIIIAH-like family protein [Oscillospiraceae bacterium]
MKKIFSAIKKHKKPIIALTLAAVVSAAVYSDMFGLGKETPVSDYLYNADFSESGKKILGEAKLVDNIEGVSDDYEMSENTYFASAVINKEKSRDEALQTLQVVVDSAEEMPETRDKALSEIMQIATEIEIETIVEEMIKAKGFEDCVAIISGDKINVIVKSDGLMTSEVAKITDIVKSETGYAAENIQIVERV